MATGTGLPIDTSGGPVVSALGGVTTVSTAGTDMWNAVGKAAGDIKRTLQPEFNRQAREQGIEDALVGGEIKPRLAINDEDIAYNNALEITYTAGATQDIERILTELSVAHANEPAAFTSASQKARSGYLQAAPPAFARVLEMEWDKASQQTAGKISASRRERDLKVATDAATTRLGALQDRVIALVQGGAAPDSPEVADAYAQFDAVNGTLRNNPLLAYGDEKAIAAEQGIRDAAAAAFVGKQAFDAFKESGAAAGEAIFAAAKQSDMFKGLDPERAALIEAEARQSYTKNVAQRTAALNLQEAETRDRERLLNKRLDDDIATVATTGQGNPDITADEIKSVLGVSGYLDYNNKRAAAYQRFQITGPMANMTPEQMTQHIASLKQDGDTFKIVDQGPNRGTPADLLPMFQQAATKYGIPIALLTAVAREESAFNPNARSPKGAMGLMQLMPGTASDLGVDPSNVAQNIEGGAKYLRQMLDLHNGDIRLALAAYNAGPGAVRKHGGVPPFAETQNYISRIAGYMRSESVSAGEAAYDNNMALRAVDPVRSVAADPVVSSLARLVAASGEKDQALNIDYIDASFAAQERIGIKNPRVLTVDRASKYATTYLAQTNDANKNAYYNDLRADLKKTYGDKYAAKAFAEIVSIATKSEATGAAVAGLMFAPPAAVINPSPKVRQNAITATLTVPVDRSLETPQPSKNPAAPTVRPGAYGSESNPIRVNTRGANEVIARLAAGTYYIDPNGNVRQKSGK